MGRRERRRHRESGPEGGDERMQAWDGASATTTNKEEASEEEGYTCSEDSWEEDSEG